MPQAQTKSDQLHLCCPYCNGSGAVQFKSQWDNPYWQSCAMCAGRGYVVSEAPRDPESEAA